MSISPGPVAVDWQNNGFIAQVMWEGTSNSLPGSFATWVEAGWTQGWQYTNVRAWYWASNRPSLGYEEWLITLAGPDNSTHKLEISQQPSDRYNVYLDSALVATALHQPPGTKWSHTGLESTSGGSHMGVTSSNNLQYRDGNNVWVNNWGPGAIGYERDAPAWGAWQFTYSKWIDGMT